MAMLHEKVLRSLIREIIVESAAIDASLLGKVKNVDSLVFGNDAKGYLRSKGMTDNEIQIVSSRINNLNIERYRRYDQAFRQYAKEFGLKASLLKAMSIEETTLGSALTNAAGSTAAGLLQITQGTLDTLNKILPSGIHYDYSLLTSNPVMSIKIAAHYIKAYLIDRLKLSDRASILKKYKTGPDAQNYVGRVEAFKKFVEITGL